MNLQSNAARPHLLRRRNRLALLAVVLGLQVGTVDVYSRVTPVSATQSPNPEGLRATARAAAAAEAFLKTLDEAQRKKVLFAFSDDTQRRNWSNLPTGIYQRAGLRLGELTEPQRKAALAILATALSPAGYTKIINILDAEQALKDAGGNPKGLVFGKDEFYFSFVGAPSPTAPWMLQFGGHHLALNLTFRGDQGVLTPSLTATQPAKFIRDGKTVRPLGEENDLSFQLINSLDAAQKAKAILGAQFRDLVLGPGHDGKTLAPEGIPASQLTSEQQQILWNLASQWIQINSAPSASAKLAEVKSHLAETYFAWSGPTTPGSAAYFRIQGPTLVIEYAPQNLGGSAINHIHTIYRDPTNDYGRRLTAP
jgi:hypothetical protein